MNRNTTTPSPGVTIPFDNIDFELIQEKDELFPHNHLQGLSEITQKLVKHKCEFIKKVR